MKNLFNFAKCAFEKLCGRIRVEGVLISNAGRVIDLFLGPYNSIVTRPWEALCG